MHIITFSIMGKKILNWYLRFVITYKMTDFEFNLFCYQNLMLTASNCEVNVLYCISIFNDSI